MSVRAADHSGGLGRGQTGWAGLETGFGRGNGLFTFRDQTCAYALSFGFVRAGRAASAVRLRTGCARRGRSRAGGGGGQYTGIPSDSGGYADIGGEQPGLFGGESGSGGGLLPSKGTGAGATVILHAIPRCA